jgi:hypothetical protein
MHSIVLALGIARVLGGIAGVARYWRQLETKWFFLGWLALLLLMHLGWWFGLWIRFGEMSDISLWTFFFWFLIPASLYIASRLLIPEFHQGSTPDLEQRFDEVRMPFFACLPVGTIPVLAGLADAGRTDWLLAVFGGLALTGLFVSDRRGHVALLCLMLATFVTFLALARSSLGN